MVEGTEGGEARVWRLKVWSWFLGFRVRLVSRV